MTAASDAPARSVMIVDDDQAFRLRLVRALRDRGLDAFGAASAEEAVLVAERESPECAVVDLRMPQASGLQLIRTLRAMDPTTRMVMLTGYGSIATALDAMRAGAVHYLTKPADADDILAALDHDGAPAASPPAVRLPTLERVEWEHIDRVLLACDGNVTKAAEVLGIHRRSLQRKLARRAPAA